MSLVSQLKARGLIHIVVLVIKSGLTILGSCEIEGCKTVHMQLFKGNGGSGVEVMMVMILMVVVVAVIEAWR